MKAEAHRQLAATLAAAALLALTACNSGDGQQTQASGEGPEQTLAAALAGSEDHSTVSNVISDAGLANVFDGVASYTVLAPRDAAFDAMGDLGLELRKPEQRAAMVAILRDHIVPGYLTPRDIRAAIERGAGNGARMKTMGGHVVTFTREGEAITVTHEDGSTARLVGDPLLAGTSLALPIDGVLKKI